MRTIRHSALAQAVRTIRTRAHAPARLSLELARNPTDSSARPSGTPVAPGWPEASARGRAPLAEEPAVVAAKLPSPLPDHPTYHELRAILRVALEAIPSPAFVLTSAGAQLETNEVGRRWLDRDPSRASALREAARGRPPFELVVTRVTGDGEGFLLVHQDLALRGGSSRLGGTAIAWKFTPREREILTLLLEGRSNRAIAASLAIAERTVETHLTSMFEKAGVQSRAELVAKTFRG